ncbi:MAG: SH3 domain-containing protein, partial [Chitinophagaceae bacterium]
MALQEKYAELIQAAKAGGLSNLQVREQANVLYI